jgi:hypothetical protein
MPLNMSKSYRPAPHTPHRNKYDSITVRKSYYDVRGVGGGAGQTKAHPRRRSIMARANANLLPSNFSSLFRGLYVRVANHLDLDPSYVSRVARGERQSSKVDNALQQEINEIIQIAAINQKNSRSRIQNGSARNGHRLVQTTKSIKVRKK